MLYQKIGPATTYRHALEFGCVVRCNLSLASMSRLGGFKIPRTTRGRIFSAALAGLLLLVASVFVFSWPRYIARAAWEEWKILSRRTPIEQVVAEGRLAPNEIAKLSLVLEAREFANNALGLPVGERFQKFSQLDRDTLVLVLSAARRDTLALHTWWFPVVGSVPYKGYFDFDEAMEEKARFERRGYDTELRPASAFSTLGWFEDPLLSTTLRADSISLVNTVLHELTHNRVFVKGEVDFNESFASFVGSRGAREFFAARGDSSAVMVIEQRWEDERTRAAYVIELLASLDSAYAAHPGDSLARVRARDTVYARAVRELVDSLTKTRGDSVARRVQARLRFNNASLLARRVYGRDLALFDSIHAALGGSLRATIDSIVAVARDSDEPFEAVRGLLRRAKGSLRSAPSASPADQSSPGLSPRALAAARRRIAARLFASAPRHRDR
jgi:predicted aminopeptidase